MRADCEKDLPTAAAVGPSVCSLMDVELTGCGVGPLSAEGEGAASSVALGPSCPAQAFIKRLATESSQQGSIGSGFGDFGGVADVAGGSVGARPQVARASRRISVGGSTLLKPCLLECNAEVEGNAE